MASSLTAVGYLGIEIPKFSTSFTIWERRPPSRSSTEFFARLRWLWWRTSGERQEQQFSTIYDLLCFPRVLAMDPCFDILKWLGPDASTKVLTCFEDPADIVRFSAVSKSWRRFVILNGFCKELCLKMCINVSCFKSVKEVSPQREPADVGSSIDMEWQNLEKEHRAYSYLSHCLVSPDGYKNCIGEAVSASSTDKYPDESIENTLLESNRVNTRWSSGGASDPGVPETLTYRLRFTLCIVNEIKVQPFEAVYHYGNPIYSARAVRFRMGHSRLSQIKGSNDTSNSSGQRSLSEDYVWSYVSPTYPMRQENCLQSFMLPRPVMCIGGILQIELLGRVQMQARDRLYYICVRRVKAIGRSLYPEYDVDILKDGQSAILKFFPPFPDSAFPALSETGDYTTQFTFKERDQHAAARRKWNNTFVENFQEFVRNL